MEDGFSFPPRGERFTETAARAVWAAILALSTAVQHQILEALQDHLARLDMGKTVSAKQRAAVSALREVARMLGAAGVPALPNEPLLCLHAAVAADLAEAGFDQQLQLSTHRPPTSPQIPIRARCDRASTCTPMSSRG